MAFDPIQEDCWRLVLESMRHEQVHLLENPSFIERGMDLFRTDPARLIRTDRDRSFHLTAKATEIIDYRLPFIADDAEADSQADLAEGYLREAVELDASNWDARRMLAALGCESNDAYVAFLLEHRDEVLADLVKLREEAADPYDREFLRDLGQRPYLRWLAAIASRQLVAGRYRMAYSAAEESLAFAPRDPAGVCRTAVYALAKLEASPEELERFQARHAAGRAGGARHLDPWTVIAEMSLAYRRFDLDGATSRLRALLRAYPEAAQSLFYQAEFPDGLFARVRVEKGSDDELILALSEATPLLQEGLDAPDNASFSLWIAEHELVQAGLDEQTRNMRASEGAARAGGEN